MKNAHYQSPHLHLNQTNHLDYGDDYPIASKSTISRTARWFSEGELGSKKWPPNVALCE